MDPSRPGGRLPGQQPSQLLHPIRARHRRHLAGRPSRSDLATQIECRRARLSARRAVLVTTGRLVGGAALAAQEYSEHLKTLGEIDFTTWDRETLIQLISDSPEVGLTGALTGALLGLLGAIDQNQVHESAP